MDLTALQQHQALTRGCGVVNLSGRTQVEIRGKDRAQLLHGLCTADIKSLRPGGGCEAFLTNTQGKTIGYIYVFCEPERLIVETVAGQSASIIASLDRYVIREDVSFVDHSADFFELLVAGPESTSSLKTALGCTADLQSFEHTSVPSTDGVLSVRRVPFIHPLSYFVSGPSEFAASTMKRFAAAGASVCAPEVADTARIESGTPLFGVDLNVDTLPQEVDRSQAISFTKGCYLGQETVARIDALGHVNWLLRGIRFDGDRMPVPGGQIAVDQKVLAKLTSVCWSPRFNAPLALAYVRRGSHGSGTRLASEWGEAEVVALPE